MLKNVVTSTDMTNEPENPPTTEHPVGTIVLGKTSVPASGTAVKAGDQVSYSVTITNPADAPITGVVVEDDLSDVLDNATLVDGPSSGAELDGTTLRWSGDLAANETVTIDYTVVVNEGEFSGTLRNVVKSDDSTNIPETENPLGSLELSKSTSIPEGTAVNRGGDVTYTVTVQNTSGADVSGATVVDDLGDVLDNATLVDGSLLVTGGGTAEIVDGILSWSGDVADGDTVTISYTVTVNADVSAGETLRNAVVSPFSPDEPETETPVGVVQLEKSAVAKPAGPVKPGSEVTYTVTVKNSSAADVNGVEVNDNLNDVLANATVTTEPTASSGTVTRNAGLLSWTGDVPAGGEATITYTVTVNDTVTTPASLRNFVVSPDSPDEPSTENPIGTLTLTKSTDVPAGATVRIGDTVTYTVGIENGSATDMTDVSVSDDLSDVLDNATFVGDPEIVTGGGELTLTGSTLTWTGDVAAGTTVELRYTVRVNDDVTGEQSLRNVVTSPDSPSVPETENPVGSVELAKTSEPAAGSGVKRGDTVSYTVSVRNTSGVDLTDVIATDDLSGVLPYADLLGDPEVVSGGGTAVIDPDTQILTWTGDLAAAQEASIRYSVRVSASAESGNVLRNLVQSPDSPEVPETEHPVVTVGLEKNVDPASGSAVRPGDEVTYEIIATNPTDVDATSVSVSDDLSDVLDNATLVAGSVTVSDGSTASVTGSTLAWTGTVPANGSITIGYKVTVNDDASAPDVLKNLVTSPHSPDTPDTENPVGSLLLTKTNDKGDGAVVKPGERVDYSVTITNPGAADLADVTVTDDLSDVLGNATWNDDAAASSGTVELDGQIMRWTGTVPAHDAITVTYSVTMSDTAEAPATIRNAVTSPDSPSTPSIENPVGTVGLAKSSVPQAGTAVKPGETVQYTVTVTNPAKAAQDGVEVIDNLSEVLAHATLVDAPVVSDGSTATVTGNTLSWTGSVPANDTVTITYEVRVNDDATAPAVLRNLVTSPDSEDTPETEHPVGTVVLTKLADPASGTAVKPGDTVSYTVTVTNPVDAPISGVRVTDQLADVLDSAELTSGPDATSGSASYDAGTQELVWEGDLDALQRVDITYSVRVNDTASQGDVLRNRVISPDSPTVPETENPVGELTTAKRILDAAGDPIPSGTVVAPGQTLTYEITASNGLTEAERFNLRDDLADVLDDAQLTAGPSVTWTSGDPVPALSFDGQVLTWDHEIPAGATVTITYTVQTDPKSDGTRVMSNTLEVNGNPGPGTENPVGTLTLRKTADPASGTAVKPGETVTYTVTADNTSDVDIAEASVTDNLSDVLDNATLTGDISVSDGSAAAIDASGQLSWTGAVPARSSVTIQYTVTVNADAAAPAVLRNLATSPNSPDEPETENPVGTVTLLKASVPEAGTSVRPGDTVDYTVTVRNSTAVEISGVSVTDDLSDVLDNAKLVDGSAVASDGSAVTVTDGKLVWNGSVPANTDIVLTYSVIVNADAIAPQQLRNVVMSPDSPDVPEVVNPVGTLRLSKTSFPGTGVAVKPGDVVDYTVTIANDASAPMLGSRVVDDLSDVLDNATLRGTPQASAGEATLTGTELTWVGDVPANGTVTLTYSVRVNDDAVAPATLRNVVSSPDSPSEPETENPVATVVLGKSSNPTSGLAVKPGDTVDYTVTVTNPGTVDLDGVLVEDNLSDILDDASLVGWPQVSDGSKVSLNGMSLTWTGKVPAGETVTITYSVLVSETAVPPAKLRNVVTSPHSPEIPETTNPVGAVKLAKTSDPASGSQVNRGDTVNYTVTVTNDTATEIRDVVFEDDLSDVLDDAELIGDPVAERGTVSVAGTTLKWQGTVPAESSVEVRYSVRVKDTAVAPATLQNVVVSPHSQDVPKTENPVAPLSPGETLPITGGDFAPLLWLALLALLGGGALLARKRGARVEGAHRA
ncbi:isopeptide-forming domain-containing fimbrial protein [Leucobacter luti]|uniref:DUF7927 domain-containing protein n=1 Tax=Leucobacter luti TaxID=340320 RepID=UPI00102C7D16|nr:isopeptide-forming domain-containing fimbrial protein [Leucobacter luti]